MNSRITLVWSCIQRLRRHEVKEVVMDQTTQDRHRSCRRGLRWCRRDVAVIEALIDVPAPVDDDGFVTTWVDALAGYFAPKPAS
ncbi:MAG: hypothetical protein HYR89_11840 [Actinobacteria bacterium]|nr:hypothetical protein [Actinomycetota bacterium]